MTLAASMMMMASAAFSAKVRKRPSPLPLKGADSPAEASIASRDEFTSSGKEEFIDAAL
jgi:hypothetical protein